MDECMNCYTPIGSKIKFTEPNAGLPFEQDKVKEHLKLNELYTLEKTEIHSFKTYIWLKEIPGIVFNSVHFENVKE